MIEIKHKDTGEVLHRVNADTLFGCTIRGIDLSGADLQLADLCNATLETVRLCGADLRFAKLSSTRFIGVTARSTDLSLARLVGAQFTLCEFPGVNFYRADCMGATFRCCSLEGANLDGVKLAMSAFLDCSGLHQARSLHTIHFAAPSSLDNNTLRDAMPELPNPFLQGCGYSLEEIETLRALYTSPIQFYSCFISHATADGDFADRLRTDLMVNNVTCWHFRYDLRGGEFWRAQINEAIKVHDKLVLVCSEQSVRSINVVDEILQAIDRERGFGDKKLFPVRLDDFIISREARDLGDAKVAAGEWPENWIAYVQRYHIPDFRRWKEHDAYQAELKKLLRDLKQPAKR